MKPARKLGKTKRITFIVLVLKSARNRKVRRC
ncbi:hypothetical protein SAMN04515679_1769 [Pelosinus fermentans]|uniref:Uncharacterized protein n=1 Tax=Pelosinus fermentans B4 TaxID=1149862 RepID=I9B6G9_9FIRM|nr:hypothetical protein FB4_1959 [Pelosinus fermentans B4]EIW25408.1 hypothetical protein FA11_2567 [Pelosinus fermentans A11]OAM93666.1 hypothetical protein FR7_01683 [Pelosinus fermentans DSM 17108]SDQ85872.1 hypothetical protein SAMN04515679_1769 [Pelosinus fermentans]